MNEVPEVDYEQYLDGHQEPLNYLFDGSLSPIKFPVEKGQFISVFA